MNKKIIIPMIIIVAALFAVNFYLINTSVSNLKDDAVLSFQSGFETGLDVSIRTIYNQTENCGKSSILVENKSKVLIDENCG